MAIDRDSLRDVVINDNEKYDDIFKKRGLYFVEQYATKRLRYPTVSEMRSISTRRHMWKVGDKYWKLADTHYDDATQWWILAWFNKKPTESHCKMGDIIYIPFPLDRLYGYFGL